MEMTNRSPMASINRRSFLKLSGVSLGGLALAACGSADQSPTTQTSALAATTGALHPDGDLTVFTWPDYLSPDVVQAFESAYDVRVNIRDFPSNAAMMKKLATGLPYDVIINSSSYLPQCIEGGLLQPIDFSLVKNSDAVVPYFKKPVYDTSTAKNYSLPYSGGPVGILYLKDKLKPGGSWDDFWSAPSDLDGHIYLLDDSSQVIGMSLLRLGHDVNSGSEAEARAAVDALLELKPRLGGITNAIQNSVESGDAWMHHSYLISAYSLMTDAQYGDVAASLDWEIAGKGQVPIAMDLLTIGKSAASPKTAHLFIDWLMRSDNAAATATFTGQLTGTVAGDKAFSEAVAKSAPSLAVPETFYEDAVWVAAPTGEREALWTREWNRFRGE